VKLVIGLGNPGSQYTHTRHNIGWLVLDRLADRAGLSGRQKSRDASVTVRGRYQDVDLALVKPMTYMNLSGTAVRKVLARDHVPLEDMLVVVDDFDLPLGRLRLREEGSAGTHNGLRSIVAEMGTQKFPRLRVGIGGHGGSAVDHVLSAFAPDERADLELVLDAAADAVESWARDGGARAANRWNAWRLPEDPAAPAPPRASDEIAQPAAEPGTPGSPLPDADGIVRTRTGWRRLLPVDSDPRR
jgi:PTH1 family peptidyl-tRNA hydrolase